MWTAVGRPVPRAHPYLSKSAAVSKAGSQIGVVVEVAQKRSFASALDWPGWCRSGRTPEDALEALAAYAGRYAAVVAVAGLRLPAVTGVESLVVIEEVEGNATTDFGAPSVAAAVEVRPATAKDANRAATLLSAAWTVSDEVVASAPAHLRKGPRGGGRDRDAIYQHVVGAEQAYAGKVGVRVRQPSRDDTAAIAAMREALLAVIRADRTGKPAREGGWAPRYCARRLAWHALDHAWEIQDRSS
jgi:hypothetical protein